MKKLLLAIIVVAIGSMAFGSSLADKPTITVNYENYTAGIAGTSATLTYLQADAEMPMTTGSFLASLRTGNNYGLSETTYKIGYKFEIK